MADRLVMIATFDQPARARLAANALAEAGVQAAVADESLVAMDWLLSGAVGGVKVQVWEEDADRAVGVLDEALGSGEAGDAEALATEAEAARPDDPGDRPAAGPAPDESPPAAPDSRDVYARRLFVVGWFGAAFPPLLPVTIYLFLNAAFGAGPLSPRGRFELIVGIVLMAPSLVIAYLFLWMAANP
ncbi:MAG: DUF2007 domain-containing protein [Gemmataceae bacterium]|nr:DUF2007 domain-containing protein [Gemmataceae bacterium]